MRLTNDVDLRGERELFNRNAADTEALRDLVAHLDACAVGERHRQTGKKRPPVIAKYVSPLIYWGENSGTMLRLGDEGVDLRSAALQAIDLARTVERVRTKHLELANQEWKIAFRRQYPDAASPG